MNRRRYLQLLGAGFAAEMMQGCRQAPAFACTQTSGLSAEENAARTTLGYIDRTTDPARTCTSCTHFVSAGSAQCGTCRLVRGPIHPQGWCRVWAQRS